MLTLIILVCGIILLGLFITFGWLWHFTPLLSPAMLKLFILVWFGVSSWNVWIAIDKAEYSLYEEIYIFPLVFLPPVLLAFMALKWF